MADINIEKKKDNNKPVWPWILGALVLIGIIWAIAGTGDDAERSEVAVVEEPYAEEQVVREPQSNRAIASEESEFVAYVNEHEDMLGENQVVTSEALIMLSEELDRLSQNNNAYSQQIDEIRRTAQEVQSTPQNQQQAGSLNVAFYNAANVLAQIKQNQYPDSEADIEGLQEKSQKIEANKTLEEQEDEVEAFFEKAADAIKELDGQTASTM